MEKGITNLTDVARSVQLLKIDGYSALSSTMTCSDFIRSTWNVGGYDWEVRLSTYCCNGNSWVKLKLVLLSEARVDKVRASLSCWLVDPSGKFAPSEEKSVSTSFSKTGQVSSDVALVHRGHHVWNDSITVECTITVVKEPKNITFPAKKDMPVSAVL
ncbi:hypothetical protein EJB05_41900, partial [Eragrostis curvula]